MRRWRRIIPLFLLLTGSFCLSGPAAAWFTPQHSDITAAAFSRLPAAVQQAFAPYLDDILSSSLAPDITIRDWENHEWNIHREPGDKTVAPARIAALARDFLDNLRQEPADLAAAAVNIGLLSHYLADLNQPLHTDDYADDNDGIHFWYEWDAYQHQGEFQPRSRGLRFREDIYQTAVAAARRANLYYQAIMDAYQEGNEDSYSHVRQLTRLNYRHAVEDIADVWATLWYRGLDAAPTLALAASQDSFRPGDMIEITLTSLGGRLAGRKADLYLAAATPDGKLWFLNPAGIFVPEIVPYRQSWEIAPWRELKAVATPLPDCRSAMTIGVYALLTIPGGNPARSESWLSNLAALPLPFTPLPADLLAEISAEPCLLPASAPGSSKVVGLSLHRWDFIFLGDKIDNPDTAGDESLLNRLIPGDYRHVLLYLGRDGRGRPCALEFAPARPCLRVVRLPEFESPYPPGGEPALPVDIEDLKAYRHRWAARLNDDCRQQLQAAAGAVLIRAAADLAADIPYQLEFQWSGDFADRQVFLVDDGRANGCSCTDYLLSLLEEEAGVCIHGSRMTAAEVENYFRHDPAGSQSYIPPPWNPFPFPVTAADILEMGFYPVDPPPHVFPCDGSRETGVPLPVKLAASPQLVPINPVPVPPAYKTWPTARAEKNAADGE